MDPKFEPKKQLKEKIETAEMKCLSSVAGYAQRRTK
jgi:hypothetical protein